MLESLKRLFSGKPVGADWREVSSWAAQRGLGFKRAHGDEGFVLDGQVAGKPWRLEWGPPHRAYIAGRELRIRCEFGLPPDLQMLLLSRPLMEQLERQTYEQFVEGTQTQIDTSTPEEMRWLVMFPKVDLARFKALRPRIGMVASVPDAALQWIDGPLAEHLAGPAQRILQGDLPFIVMTLRGRVYLRMQALEPDPQTLGGAIALFELAALQAQRAGTAVASPEAPGAPPSSTAGESGWPAAADPTAWQSLDSTPPRREP